VQYRALRDDLVLWGDHEVRTDAIEQWLHRGVLYRRAQENRREFEGDGRAADHGRELLCGGERVVQEKIGDLGELFDELCAFLGGQVDGRGWYLVRFDDIDTV
jgi:hypothetical protein